MNLVSQLLQAKSESEVAALIATAAHEALGATSAAFVVRRGDEVEYVDVVSSPSALRNGVRFKMSECICGQVICDSIPISVVDLKADEDPRFEFLRRLGARGLMIVPVFAEVSGDKRPAGAVLCYWSEPFTPKPEDREQLNAIAQFAGNFLEHTALIAALQRTREEATQRAAHVTQLNSHLRNVINELDHRVRNNLAVVWSLAEETYRHSSPQRFMAAFRGRLRMLIRVHELLSSADWRGVRMTDIVRTFVPFPQQASATPGPDAHGPAFTAEGPDSWIPRHLVLPIAASLHELAVNAQEHGPWATADGTAGAVPSASPSGVMLAWQMTEPGRLKLCWEERGATLPAVAVESKLGSGFGTSLAIGLLRDEAMAKTAFTTTAHGIRFEAEVPLDGRLRTAPVPIPPSELAGHN